MVTYPEFWNLSPAEQQALLRGFDAAYAALPKAEQIKFLEQLPSLLSADERAAIISAKTLAGDGYFDRGDYDSALSEYEIGLKLDPSNASLHARVERARDAKTREGLIP